MVSFKISRLGCEKHITEITNKAAADVNFNQSRKWKQDWLVSLKPSVSHKTLFLSKNTIDSRSRNNTCYIAAYMSQRVNFSLFMNK